MGLVVIIDDEELICEELLDCVEALGRCGRTFTNPHLALAFLNQTNKAVDVVFVDVMMPEMNGDTFISNASEVTGKKTRYYLMSGVRKSEVYSISDRSENSFLQKPLSLARVKKCLT